MNEFLKLLTSVLPLSSKEKELIKSYFNEEYLKKGDNYLEVSHVAKKIGFVADGLLKSVCIKENGNTYISNFIQKREFAVNLGSLITQTPSKEFIEVIRETHILSINTSSYKELISKVEKFNQIMFLLMERTFIERNTLKSQLLSENAENRLSILLKTNPELLREAPKKDIASFLGLSKYTVSRIKLIN